MLIEFILPLELSALCHTIIPEHQTPWDSLMELSSQIPQENGHVLYSDCLGETEENQTSGRVRRGEAHRNPGPRCPSP